MENKNVPSIRFKGFIDDWEQRKLGEAVTFLNGRAYKQKELLDKGKYRVLRVGNFNTNDFWYYSDLELEDNKYANKGDLLYLWATNFGPEIWKEERVIYHYHIWKLDINDVNLDKNYLYTWLITDKERIKQTTNGTTMVHITKGGMEERLFQNPTNIDEQIKIGNLFEQLDESIALQERELELMKVTKKGFLQQIFPENKRKYPNIRFENFHEEWQQRKLGEESDVRDGTHDSPKYFEKGYPLVTSKNLKSYGLDLSDVSFISNEDFELINNRSKVDIGDILFGMIGTIGNPVLVERNDFAIKNVALIKENNNTSNHFLIQLFKSPIFDRYIANENAGGTQKFLALSKIRNFEFLSPSKNEQKQISNFFKRLDETITLQEKKIENLKNIKSAFLQKMFA
ncbi:restriction endonuclease subunit S [Vagococcus fluvialis]|uniref:restriction endonuclease subunit S n=1 Tax=Vagococcus fluvialis TaxID=2738 RepID=UPI003B215EC4